MTAPLPAAPRPAPGADRSSPGDLATALRRACAELTHHLESAPHGRIVSVTLPLPGVELPDLLALDADSLWTAAGETACARGEAQVIEADGPHRLAQCFSELRRSWDTVGDGTLPRAFFAFPFQAGPARLWVPRVLVLRQAACASAVVTAVAGAGAAAVLADAERLLLGRPAAAAPWAPARASRTAEHPAASDWLERVSAAAQAVAEGRLDKVVLSRSIDLDLSRPLDPGRAVRTLAARYPHCNVFALPHGGGAVVAASPERLAVKRGSRVTSHCLAGTTRRGATLAEDARLADALLASAKERGEHALVVAAVTDALGGLCTGLAHPRDPQVMRLRLLQHLWTPVTGRLRPGHHLLDVVAQVHPTPAVAGWPQAAALAWLDEIGERRGGWYTGAAGWIDADGDGEAAVVLRSALLQGRTARLWAGAGIVAGSSPEAELAETDLKLATLLDVLEQG